MNWPAIFLVAMAFFLVTPAAVLRIARALRAVYDREDATFARFRDDGMGDLSSTEAKGGRRDERK